MPQPQGPKSSSGGRLSCEVGTDLVAGNVALGAGWATEGAVAIAAGSNDVAGLLTVTCGATSPAQATATITVTFADGAYNAAPFIIATVTSNSSIDEGHVTWSSTTTGFVLTFSVLPVSTKVYKFTYAVIGKKSA